MTEPGQPAPQENRILQNISKEEAARRQIDRAIKMFFEGDDDLCTHVLTFSAGTLLVEYCKAIGLKSSHAEMIARVKPEAKRRFLGLKKEAYNYLKHADRDHDKALERFDPMMTPMILLAATYDFAIAFKATSSAMLVFRAWIHLRFPTIFGEEKDFSKEILETVFGPIETITLDAAKKRGATLLVEIKRFEDMSDETPILNEKFGPIYRSSKHFPR